MTLFFGYNLFIFIALYVGWFDKGPFIVFEKEIKKVEKSLDGWLNKWVIIDLDTQIKRAERSQADCIFSVVNKTDFIEQFDQIRICIEKYTPQINELKSQREERGI